MGKIIVTSALPYSYSVPHLGNLVGSILPADVYYKYLKMAGEDAIYISGSDQHGTPIELEAMRRGVRAESFADEMHLKLKELFEKFGMTFTYYGKTHTEHNKEVVYQVFEGLRKNGYIIETEGLHPKCENENMFLADRFIEGKCPFCGADNARGDQCNSCNRLITPEELIKPHCTVCKQTNIRFYKTKNLAIDYAKMQPRIEEFLKGSKGDNWSKNAINKALSYIDEGLKPVEITRYTKWGFPVPVEGFEDAVFYVWFDAPIGYIGITKEWDEKRWKDYWTDNKTKLVQFLGKDNIQFHTIHWPGMLIGSGMEFVKPYSIRASEFLNLKGGQKFSKSEKRGVDMEKALELMPADYWRFTLMYIYPETADSEMTMEALEECVNSLMNDKIGNLVNRVFTLAKNNRVLLSRDAKMDEASSKALEAAIGRYRKHFENAELREALRAVVEVADIGNALMNSKEPWALAKKASQDKAAAAEFDMAISTIMCIVRDMAVLLYPFAPDASARALKMFGMDGQPSLKDLEKKVSPDLEAAVKPLFAKMDPEKTAQLKAFFP